MNRALWPLLSGFTLWALGFIALYTLQALGCFWHWDPLVHRLALIAAYLLILAALAALALQQRHRLKTVTDPDRFIARAGLLATTAAFAAAALIFAPTLIVDACR